MEKKKAYTKFQAYYLQDGKWAEGMTFTCVKISDAEKHAEAFYGIDYKLKAVTDEK